LPKYHTENFYKPLEQSFRKDLKVLVEDNDKILLNCNNATLEFNSNGVIEREARKEDYLTYKLKYDYDVNAKCPTWNKFLDEMLPQENEQFLLHQYVGYSFTTYLNIEKLLFLLGKGGNGKSVVQDVITELLGKENTSQVSIGALTQDRNERLLIEHKLLNYCGENEKSFNLATLRALVSGEPIIVEAKYVYKRMMTRYAKLMFNINSMPRIVEEAESYLRRLMILEFKNKPKVKDTELSQKIAKAELSGVLNRVIAALQVLLRDKAFVCIPGVSEFSSSEANVDAVQDFINENSSNPNPVKASELYNSYESYCFENQVPKLSMNSFCKDLNKKGFYPIKRNDGNYYNI
jgi:putative DNA primase/helicase